MIDTPPRMHYVDRVDSLSIGAVVRLTGISADTLRTWERRYGYPRPARNEAGHRRYEREVFEHLMLVKDMIARGHRPSQVIRLPKEELVSALGQAPRDPASDGDPNTRGVTVNQRAYELRLALLLKIEKLDGDAIESLLSHAWQQFGGQTTVTQVVVPLLTQVGERWRAGRFGIHHEHLFSSRLSTFLMGRWQHLSDHATGPLVALATPPGEEHELGLQVAASLFALGGARILYLGLETPAPVLLAAATQAQAQAVACSVSVLYPVDLTHVYLSYLSQVYRPDQLLVGGAGALAVQHPCLRLASMSDVDAWLAGRGVVNGALHAPALSSQVAPQPCAHEAYTV